MTLSPVVFALLLIAACAVAFFVGWVAHKRVGEGKVFNAEQLAAKMLKEAERESETLKKSALLEAKDEWFREKQKFDREMQAQKGDLATSERRLRDQETSLNRRAEVLDKKERDQKRLERDLELKSAALEERDLELAHLVAEQNARLQRISGMTAEEAKHMLISNLEHEARVESAKRLQEIREEMNRTAEREAREVLTLAIQRCAADHTAETTVSVVHLPSDEMKGRIIGREGRNIRAFETVTGIDVIIDDTPEAVILSGFDPVRREVAKRALERLVTDGRIHPARIEEIVAKVQKEVDEQIVELGEEAVLDVGIHGMHPEIVKLLGRLHYRTSYGQNILQHSKEVSWICGIMAAQLGFDVQVAKRSGLLHDLGKAVTHEVEGAHAQISMEYAQKYGEPDDVVRAVGYHHHDPTAQNLYAVLVMAADAVSGARPGARRESIENYVKRLEALEKIADSFPGVERSFAIQAGREVRIMVEPKRVDDVHASQLAADVARKIEKELQYPGQIKVVVIRETRAMEYAR
ncbi:MAG TPA: ribonuclease Y [Candidatus Eisenbacteria bacterium]|jgi:ribonuclease Y